MQGTLFRYGITKKVHIASGGTYVVTSSIPMSATTSSNVEKLQCSIGKSKFSSQQYHDIHIHWKHMESIPIPEESVNRHEHGSYVDPRDLKGTVSFLKTNKKNISSEDCRGAIQVFHRTLRRSLKTSRQRNTNAQVDPKWGRWLPENRYNVDQVPLPFVVNQGKTYADKGSKQIWVSQPTSGLDKR
eukprot:gene2517-2908_t